jgi:hypothetical protein
VSKTTHSLTTYYDRLVNVLGVKIDIAPAFDPKQTTYPYRTYGAIWDTGATNSVITEKVIAECNLKPIGMTNVQGVHGAETSEVYLVNIILPNKVNFVGMRVTKGKLPKDANVLIGMDIINKGDFALTHNANKTVLSFRVPSIGHIDFVEKKAAGLKVGRNNPCPCGSEKKYKRCCGKEK